MIRIIDNKKIWLTDSEYALYLQLVQSYTSQYEKGEEFFRDLFETDENGIIIFLKPPTKVRTSMECYMFLVNIMIHQHIGSACGQAEHYIREVKNVIQEGKELIEELKAMKGMLK